MSGFSTLAHLTLDFAAWIGRESRRTDVISRAARPVLQGDARAASGGHARRAAWRVLVSSTRHRLSTANSALTAILASGCFFRPCPIRGACGLGGELEFYRRLCGGRRGRTKTSTVADIAFKTGGSGKLAFVTVRHQYHVGERLVLAERQDVVYRDAEGTGSKPRHRPPAEAPADVLSSRTVTTDPTLLFRYSALTFNSHRIHYDQPYATEREGYDGLVVHGPLQATLLLNLAADTMATVPRRLSYRGQAPLMCAAPVRLEAMRHEGGVSLRVLDQNGSVTMSAIAES